MLSRCESDICIFKYTNPQQWEQLSRIVFGIDELEEVIRYSVTPHSLIQTDDGKYFLAYSFDDNDDSTRSNIFIIKSSNLIDWSAPIQVSNEEDFDVNSKLIQLDDGSLMLVYGSYARQALIIKTSPKGEVWTEKQVIPGYPHLNTSLIKYGENVRLFYSDDKNFYTQYLNSNKLFTNKEFIINYKGFSPHVIRMLDGTFGMVYSLDHNEQRDVFFENIGTFNQ